MEFVRHFSPLLVFLCLYLGASFYFINIGNADAFYQFSPLKAIIPAVLLGIFSAPFSVKNNIISFIRGAKNSDILMMSGIFLLSGIFCPLTTLIGGVDTLVQGTLQFFPHHFLLIAVFLISAIVSTAIGTSMGVVALMVPIAVQLAEQGVFDLNIGVATVISGAMFGDNLSFVSDTTIASVMSQGADAKKKFQVNAIIAGWSGFIMIGILCFFPTHKLIIPSKSVDPLNVLPYAILLGLAFSKFSVFNVLLGGIASALVIGSFHHDIPSETLFKCMVKGGSDMQEIIILSMLIGGLGKLLQDKGAMDYLLQKIIVFVDKKNQQKRAEGIIATTVSLMDILLANNTIAIIITGNLAKRIAQKYGIPAHQSATLLGNFSCVFQGILPYGAQILLASKLSGVVTVSLSFQVYYCFILGFVTILYINYKRLFSSFIHIDK